MDVNDSLLVRFNNTEAVRLFGQSLIGSIPIGARLIANIFRLAMDPYAVPFQEIWGYPAPLITFLSHCPLHVNHSSMCKSN